MKLSAEEVNRVKAVIEGGAGESLYNRLKWNTPKNVHLSQAEKDILWWHIEENEYLKEIEKVLFMRMAL